MSLLRLSQCSQTVKVTTEVFVTNFWSYNTVRWGKKPRWLPIAKTKMFKISLRPETPPEELEEIKRLFNNYRTIIKSLKQYFEDKHSVANQVQFDVEQHEKAVAEDFARCSSINNKWNADQKIIREQRMQKDMVDTLVQAQQRLEARIKVEAEQLDQAEEIVRKEKISSVHFITPDKLDSAIEYAINNPVDYNYAIDPDGNKIWGRETQPPEKVEQEKLSIKQ